MSEKAVYNICNKHIDYFPECPECVIDRLTAENAELRAKIERLEDRIQDEIPTLDAINDRYLGALEHIRDYDSSASWHSIVSHIQSIAAEALEEKP